MIGTRQGPFHFRCPLCHARPTKPCVRLNDRSKTTKVHDERKAAYYRAIGKDSVKVVWGNAIETKRSRH